MAGKSPRTRALRRQVMTRLIVACGPLEGITTDGATRWLAGLGVSHSTRATYTSLLRGFYHWAEDAGHLPDIGRKLPMPRVPRRVPRPLQLTDVEVAMRLADRPISTWILLGAFAGLRCLEIAGLRGEDLQGTWLYVASGKGGHQRMVPAHELVVAELADYPASGRLWETSAKQVSRRGNIWLAKLGVGGTMHQLRHTFATQVYSATSDLLVTQQLLGHASPATTAIYAQVSGARLVDAVAAIGRPA